MSLFLQPIHQGFDEITKADADKVVVTAEPGTKYEDDESPLDATLTFTNVPDGYMPKIVALIDKTQNPEQTVDNSPAFDNQSAEKDADGNWKITNIGGVDGTSATYVVQYVPDPELLSEGNSSDKYTVSTGVVSPAPTNITTSNELGTDGKGVISGLESSKIYAYKKDGEDTWVRIPSDQIDENGNYTVGVGSGTYQIKEIDENDADVTKPATIIVVDSEPENSSNNQGKITGLEADKTYKYKKEGSDTWITVPADSTEITNLAEGTYVVSFADDSATTTVGVSNLLDAPKLTSYSQDGTDDQGYVEVPTSQDSEPQYAISNDGGKTWAVTSPNQNNFVAKEAGTYLVKEVEAKSTGDANNPWTIVRDKSQVATTIIVKAVKENAGQNNGQITGLDPAKTYQYSTDGQNWTDVPSGSSTIDNLSTATYQVRLADNTDAVTTVTVGEIAGLSPAPSASTTPENEGESNGKITGLESDKSYEYSADGGKTWKTVPAGSTEVTGLSTGEYQVRIVDGSGNATSEAATVTVGLIPAAPVVGTTPSVRDQKTGTITGLDGAKSYEYSTDGGVTWIAVTPGSTTIEGLPTGGYQVRVAANGDVPASKAATANVGVIDPAPSASTTPENEGESNGKITGLDSDKSYQYSTDGGVNWINVPAGSPEVTGLPTGEYQVRIVDASGNATSLVAKVTVGVVNKPAAPSLQSTPSGSNNNEGTITGLDPNVEYEYRKVGESEFTDVPAGSSSITGLTAGSYEVRVKAKGETRASQIATVTVASSTVTPAAPDNVGTASVTKRGVTNGRIIGLNPLSLYEYRMAGTDNWISVPAGSTEIDGLAAGSYELRYAASTTTGAAASESVELTVGEAANGSSLSSGSSYAPWMGIAGAAGLGFFILAAASLCTDQFGIVSYQIPTRRPESINLNKRDNDNLAPHLRRCDEGAVNFVVPASPLCTDDAGIASYKLAGHRPESLGLSEKDNREVAPFLRPCDKNETDIAGPGGTFCTDANGIASRQHPGARPESLGLTDLENRNIAPRLGRCSE